MAKVRKLRGLERMDSIWAPACMYIVLDRPVDLKAAQDLEKAHGFLIEVENRIVVASRVPEGLSLEREPLRWLIRQICHKISARSNQIASAKGRNDPIPAPTAAMLEPIKAPRNRIKVRPRFVYIRAPYTSSQQD